MEYLDLAGQQAVQRSANVEAISHLTAALEMMKALPETPERDQQELALRITLGPPLTATKGWATPELGQSYARARELCEQLGETSQLFPVLFGLYAFYVVRPEYQIAQELSEQLLHLAQTAQDPALRVEAHFAVGLRLGYLGEFIPARAHLEQGIACYDPQQHRSLAFTYAGQDPGVACCSFAALVLWQLGYPEQAMARGHQALTLARDLSHPPSLAFGQSIIAFGHQFRRESQVTQELAEAVIRLCTEQEIGFWLAWGTILHGWALGMQGQAEEGGAQICQGIAAVQATHAGFHRPCFLGLLAEVYGKGGQAEEGLALLAEAQAIIDETGERYYEAELYRLKGELVLQSGVSSPESDAEECFQKTIEIARQQQAKSWELRATMSLARLWQKQGKKAEARQMLAEVYNWFTEGFNTVDLQEAKALLTELPNNDDPN